MLSLTGKRASGKHLNNNTPIYMLAKSPGLSLFYPPNKLAYYTLPYRVRGCKKLENVLITFINQNVVVNVQKYLVKQENLHNSITHDNLSQDDKIDNMFLYNDIYVHTTDLENVKVLSDTINMPLLVIMPKREIYVYKPSKTY